uniref:Non-selective voltage-gated ion channel VDAC3 n=1 Tax=Oryzias melastigma TaxID=30732 RepID=A0A3B3DGP8_ORYME
MAVPPAYSDLQKSFKNIFNKTFVYGNFATSGSNITDMGKSGGYLETKYKLNKLGLSFSKKWNTDNLLTKKITMEDQLTKGLNLGLGMSFVPNTGKKSAKLKIGYKQNNMNLDFGYTLTLSQGVKLTLCKN